MSIIVTPPRTNVADRLADSARKLPGRLAVVEALAGRRHRPLGERYRTIRFADLDTRANYIARGLIEMGVSPKTRLALLVRPGVDFVALVFGVLRSGASLVLVDAGLGRKNIVDCLAATEPEGFIGIPLAHLLRLYYRRRFRLAKYNVTVGRRWSWGGLTLSGIEAIGSQSRVTLPHTSAGDAAAIVFTSGSTGPPKGVEYRHETFTTQLIEIERMYGLQPGGVDLACFPLFGLFNVALGITTVLPEMDFSRPAACDPAKLIAAAQDWNVTQSFASPAVWDRLSRYCHEHRLAIPTLRALFSCGAPVPLSVIERTLAHVQSQAKMHTPYGATECLPISSIDAAELSLIDADTAISWRPLMGSVSPGQEAIGYRNVANHVANGVCVGRRVESIDWRVIAITDEPITSMKEASAVADGEIGELIVRGPQVSRRYVALNAERANEVAKIRDGDTLWHRTGDVGYFDSPVKDEQRFWYCGRKSQRVVLADRTLFTECAEGIAKAHPDVHRAALVGVGVGAGHRVVPVIIIEPEPSQWTSNSEPGVREFLKQHEMTSGITHLMIHPKLPVDIRHNSKICREQLAAWAAQRIMNERKTSLCK